MLITLTRDTPAPDLWLGILEVDGRKFHTLEPADACVPEGVYRVRPHARPSGEQCFVISCSSLSIYEKPLDVPPSKRSEAWSQVFIHAGEFYWDANRSIALGKGRELVSVQGSAGAARTWKMIETKCAMNELRTLIGRKWDVQLAISKAEEARRAS